MTRVWAIRLLALAGSLGLTLSVAGGSVGSATAGDDSSKAAMPIAANLSGFNEVPPILTNGTATFRAVVHSDNTITYTLTFSGLTSDVTQAHLHFGERGVSGGIFLFLCTNLGNGPAGTPACPAAGGTVTGTLTAASVTAVAAQNVTAGDFAGAKRIIQSGDAYANVHSKNFPAGEIRGQVHFG
jgi:hypothetical protein